MTVMFHVRKAACIVAGIFSDAAWELIIGAVTIPVLYYVILLPLAALKVPVPSPLPYWIWPIWFASARSVVRQLNGIDPFPKTRTDAMIAELREYEDRRLARRQASKQRNGRD